MLAALNGQTITTDDTISPLLEITDYPEPPGVLFVADEAHANQPRAHAVQTSVTQALTKVPESLKY